MSMGGTDQRPVPLHTPGEWGGEEGGGEGGGEGREKKGGW